MKHVGFKIRQARLEARLTLDQLAERTGTSRQHLIKLEKGVHTPRGRMLHAIAQATGKPVEFFDADDEEESPSMENVLLEIARAHAELSRLVLAMETRRAS